MKEALRPPSGSPIIGGQGGLRNRFYTVDLLRKYPALEVQGF